MGDYVYRISKAKVKCSDGLMANVALYAYKPWRSIFDENANRKMHWKSGAAASDRMARLGNVLDRFVLASKVGDKLELHGSVYRNPDKVGSFLDGMLGSARFPHLPDVKPINPDA